MLQPMEWFDLLFTCHYDTLPGAMVRLKPAKFCARKFKSPALRSDAGNDDYF
jgi:hypothetical protein